MKLKDLLIKLNDIKYFLGEEVEICTVDKFDDDNMFNPIKDAFDVFLFAICISMVTFLQR